MEVLGLAYIFHSSPVSATSRAESRFTSSSGAIIAANHKLAAPNMSETKHPQPNGTLAGAAESEQSTRRAAEMIELSRPECVRLLAATSIGRVVVNMPGWNHPLIRPVNYVFDQSSQSVLLRSALGSKLYAILHSAWAAFEIDGIDPADRVGWSVIILGVCEEITDTAELRRIEALGVEPWAPGHKGHWIRIRPNTVSGREIVMAAPGVPAHDG
jgi:uncharacterized protein